MLVNTLSNVEKRDLKFTKKTKKQIALHSTFTLPF